MEIGAPVGGPLFSLSTEISAPGMGNALISLRKIPNIFSEEIFPRSIPFTKAIVIFDFCGVGALSGLKGSPAFLPTFEITELMAPSAFSRLIMSKTFFSKTLETESVTLASVPMGKLL